MVPKPVPASLRFCFYFLTAAAEATKLLEIRCCRKSSRKTFVLRFTSSIFFFKASNFQIIIIIHFSPWPFWRIKDWILRLLERTNVLLCLYLHRMFLFFYLKGKENTPPHVERINKQQTWSNYCNIQYIWSEDCSSFPWSLPFFLWEWRQDCTRERKTTERRGCRIIVVEWFSRQSIFLFFCLVRFHGFTSVPHPAKMWAEDVFWEHEQVQVFLLVLFVSWVFRKLTRRQLKNAKSSV